MTTDHQDRQVAVAVTVVPAGIREVAGKAVVRAALTFTPLAPADAYPSAPRVAIGDWPGAIGRLVRPMDGSTGLTIDFATIVPASGLPLLDPGRMNKAGPVAFGLVGKAPNEGQRESVQKLWRALMSPNDGWKSLLEVICQNHLAGQFGRLRPGGADGAVKPKDSLDIVAVGRGQTALRLVVERGRSLLDRLCADPDVSDGLVAAQTQAASEQKEGEFVSDPLDNDRPGNDALKRSREAAGRISDQLAKLGTTDGVALREAYRALLEINKAGCDPSGCIAEAGGADLAKLRQSIREGIRQHDLDSRVPAYDDADGSPRKDDLPGLALEAAQLRLMALQADPVLSRLFGLTVDVTLSLDVPAHDAFLLLSVGREQWTLAKLGRHSGFWPCGRLEAQLHATNAVATDAALRRQALGLVDGFVNFRAGAGDAARFDLVTVDIEDAIEGRRADDNQVSDGAPAMRTYRSGGFTIVDGWRQEAALKELVAGSEGEGRVVDAADLFAGVEIDLGLEAKRNVPPTWRSLVRRAVSYDPEGLADLNGPKLEALIAAAVPDPQDRANYSNAMSRPVTKIVQRFKLRESVPPEPGEQREVLGKFLGDTAFVQDTIAQWKGPPLGIDPTSTKPTVVDEITGLALSTNFGLFHSGPKAPGGTPHPSMLIHRLAFGRRYGFRLRARFEGGVARRPDDAVPVDQVAQVQLPPTDGLRRYLRHERIDAPLITAPQSVFERVFDRTPDGTREAGRSAVIRADDGGRVSTIRFVVPPAVAADFADRHDVFEGKLDERTYETKLGKPPSPKWKGPRGGLEDLGYGISTAGFPVWPDGAPTPSHGCKSEAIFRPSAAKPATVRREPYYPDPAADHIVVALTDVLGRPLPGDPLVVPVRPAGAGVKWPDVRPIAIEMLPGKDLAAEALDQANIVSLSAVGKELIGSEALRDKAPKLRTFYADASGELGAAPGAGKVAVTRVQIRLPKGVAVRIGMWCMPDRDHLLHWFDVVETAAALACSRTACKDIAGKLGPLPLGPGLGALACAAGARVDPSAVRKVGQLVLARMVAAPVPEVAATTTVDLAHGLRQPTGQVELTATQGDGSTLNPLSIAFAGDGQSLKIDGDVALVREIAGSLDLEASGASLVSGAFDHPSRGRFRDEVVRGLWPRSLVTGERRHPKEVYGFEVDPSDGRVTLPRERATLLRIEDGIIGARLPAGERRDRLDIAKAVADAKSRPPSSDSVRVSYPFRVADNRARILEVHASASSRTAHLFRLEATPSIPSQAGADVRREDRRWGDTRPAEEDRQRSKSVSVILRSTVQPSRVSPLTVLPAFKWETKPNWTERTARLRIRMRRPWFSSGEGERLGIVLWPPEIASRTQARPDTVSRDYFDETPKDTSAISLPQMSDLDLGPGGPFVTRWGGDPIKSGTRPRGSLVTASQLPDIENATRAPMDGPLLVGELKDNGPLYVPRATMPLPAPAGSAPDAKRPPETMEVALLAYSPRFDLDSECWYVDLDFKPGPVPTPFVRLGLVRYQPYAATPELAVSEPVVEWVQAPPLREVAVEVASHGAKDGAPAFWRVTATVSGAAHTFSAEEKLGAPYESIRSWLQSPIVRATLLRREGAAEVPASMTGRAVSGFPRLSDRAEMTFVPETQSDWDGYLGAVAARSPDKEARNGHRRAADHQPAAVSDGLRWTVSFDLAEDPRPLNGAARYSMFVEEVEAMRPATYPDEPFDDQAGAEPRDDERIVLSGPRFSARVDIA
jgi:hypothetical protein